MPQNIDSTLFHQNRQLMNKYGAQLERSLFIPQFESEFNQDERNVAVYLDGDNALKWWHRNVARSQYGIQGWKKGKIYPDFIFSARIEGGKWRIYAIETKGDHLGNDDTEYKSKLLSFLTRKYVQEAGDLTAIHCELVLMSEWETVLPEMLGSAYSAQ